MGLLLAEHVGIDVSILTNGRASSLLLLLISISDKVDLPCPLSNRLRGGFRLSPVSPRFPPVSPPVPGRLVLFLFFDIRRVSLYNFY